MRILDRKSTRLNSSHRCISYAVFCLKKKDKRDRRQFAVWCSAGGAVLVVRPRTVRAHSAEHTPSRGHLSSWSLSSLVFFFFNDTATPEIYTLSLHDALPI